MRFSIAIAALLLATPAFAQIAPAPAPVPGPTPYTFDAKTVLLGENKQPLPDPQACKAPATKDTPPADCAWLTAGEAIRHILFFGGYKDQSTVTAETMWARWALGNRIESNDHATLSGPEITVIETLMPQYYPSPIIAGQLMPLIDPSAKPGAIK